MKKLATGLAISAVTLLPMAEVAHAQQSELCETVYDEVGGELSGTLRSVIGEYALNGVEVHVQILENGRDDGLRSVADVETFSENLATLCGWGDDLVNVLISLNPRAYDIHRDGDADRAITVTSRDEDTFINNLRDSNSSFQSDAAQLLSDISPYVPAQAQDANSLNNASTSRNTEEPPNIPYKKIFTLLTAAAFAVAASFRIKRGLEIRDIRAIALQGSQQSKLSSLQAGKISKEWVRILPEGDAPHLVSSTASLATANEMLGQAEENFKGTMREQQTSLWPDMSKVANGVKALSDQAQNTESIGSDLSQETERIESIIAKVDAFIDDFQELIHETESATTSLLDDGWEIDAFTEEIGGFKSTLQRVRDLRKQNFVVKPNDIVDTVDDRLMELLEEVKAIRDLRNEAINDHAAHTEHLLAFGQLHQDITKEFDFLTSNYHDSCIESLGNAPDTLSQYINHAQEVHSEEAILAQKKGVQALATMHELAARFNNIRSSIESLEADVMVRKEKLATIVRTLPERNIATASSIDDVGVYIAEQPGQDIEQSTKDQLQSLREEFQTYLNDDHTDDKPRYLELMEKAEQYALAIKSLASKAKAEKSEMDSLRSSLISTRSSLSSAKSAASTYIRNNSSDISAGTASRLRAVQIQDGDSSGSRQSLKQQLAGYAETDTYIDDVLAEAKSQVAAAEARRARAARERREREEREAREARERQRRMNESSSSTFGGFSGGGGGGSHSSGGW